MSPLFTVISFPFLCVLLPIAALKITAKVESLKTNTYYLTTSVCQGLGQHGWVLWTRVSHKAAVEVQLSQGSPCGRTCSRLLCGCWLASGSHWLLSGDINSWPCGLLLQGCSQPSSLLPPEQRL